MKITSVDIDLGGDQFAPAVRSQYQFVSNYLTMCISDWIKSQNIDLGPFNRIVFEEGQDDDLSVVGDKAFIVCLSQEFSGFDSLNTAKNVHDYFVQKYLEGFSRLDKEFGLKLVPQLSEFINAKFQDSFDYKYIIKSKTFNKTIYQVVGCYKYNVFELILKILDSNKKTTKEAVMFSSAPDPFIVDYDINKVEIEEGCVKVINKVRELTLDYNM